MVSKWIACSGEEWTVKRLKAFKQYIVSLHSGITPPVPFAKNRKGEMKGVLGYLARWSRSNEKSFSRVLQASMAYTALQASEVTPTQRKKFLKGVLAPVVVNPPYLEAAIVAATKKAIGSRKIETVPKSLFEWIGSPSKRAPTCRYGSVGQDSKILSELFLLDNDAILDHVKSLWEPIYKWVFREIDFNRFCDSVHDDDRVDGPLRCGEVHFLQEPGYKLRSIASPYRLFQIASEPLKKDLKRVVEQLPWDCTHNQAKATDYIQQHLQHGKKVHSVDLTSATDVFPLDIQEKVLQAIYGVDNPFVRLFSEISQGTYSSELGDITWNKGQPLGFNPSFFAFTLSHGILLFTLNGMRHDNMFFVVGDDVIILDDRLYKKYLEVLDVLDCPYSPEKSVSSSIMGEFAGKIITATGVIPQLKWKVPSDDSFMDLARLLGPKSMRLFSRRQQKVIESFAHVHTLHPYGLNWSAPGTNLESALREAFRLLNDQAVTTVASLTGLTGRINRTLHGKDLQTKTAVPFILEREIRDTVRTFDEKVRLAFAELGYHNHDYCRFVENLFDLPGTQEPIIGSLLPRQHMTSSRRSLLTRLLNFLKGKPSRE